MLDKLPFYGGTKSTARKLVGGPKDVGYKKAGSLCHNEEPTVISRSMLNIAVRPHRSVPRSLHCPLE